MYNIGLGDLTYCHFKFQFKVEIQQCNSRSLVLINLSFVTSAIILREFEVDIFFLFDGSHRHKTNILH